MSGRAMRAAPGGSRAPRAPGLPLGYRVSHLEVG
jgi:hypothetical protein